MKPSRELVTGRLFETLHLFPNDKSQRKLRALLDGNSVAKHVRNIHLYTYTGPESISDADSDLASDLDPQGYEQDGPDEPLPNTKEQISSLLRFPNLGHVALYFTKYTTQERFDTIEFREATANLFFSTLVSSSLRLHRLSVRGLQGERIKDPETLEIIPKVLCGLRELHLQVASILLSYFGVVFRMTDNQTNSLVQLPSVWLNPTMSSLEHLTLSSSNPFGLYPRLDLSSIHFPNLKSLALGRYTFFHDEQMDWIVSHAPTLRILDLQDCPILHATIVKSQVEVEACHPVLLNETWEVITRRYYPDTSMRYFYPRRWHDYFTTFRTKLTHLRHFHFAYSKLSASLFSPETDIYLAPPRYGVFDSADGCRVHHRVWYPEEEGHRPSCDDEDREALRALLEKIGQSYLELERRPDSSFSMED